MICPYRGRYAPAGRPEHPLKPALDFSPARLRFRGSGTGFGDLKIPMSHFLGQCRDLVIAFVQKPPPFPFSGLAEQAEFVDSAIAFFQGFHQCLAFSLDSGESIFVMFGQGSQLLDFLIPVPQVGW